MNDIENEWTPRTLTTCILAALLVLTWTQSCATEKRVEEITLKLERVEVHIHNESHPEVNHGAHTGSEKD